MDRVRRILAFNICIILVAGLLGACASGKNYGTETEQGTEGTESVEQVNRTPLVIACGSMSENFSEFFPETSGDQTAADLTAVYLLGTDRTGEYILNGKSGEIKDYNGNSYNYTGIADCKITSHDDGSVSYKFSLRKDLTFSDGEPLTADDVIFSMYVYLDSAYDGKVELNTLPIVGLADYTGTTEQLYQLILERGENNTTFDVYTKKMQKKFFDTDWPKAQKQFIKNIMAHYDTKSVAKAMCALGYAYEGEDGRVSSAYTYNHWSMEGDDKPSVDDFLRELVYNSSLEVVSENLVKSGIVEEGVYDLLPDKYHKSVEIGGATAKSIKGIEKRGTYTVQVTLAKADPTALEKLAIPVQPLHYYGDSSLYNYKKNKFGFQKGDLSGVKEKSNAPLGAGPYIYEGYSNGVAYFTANENFYKGAPQIPVVQLMEMSESDMAYEIVEGIVDIAEPSITKADLEQLREVNSNGSENGDVISTTFTDYAAYGYIGINAQNVCVNEQPRSAESMYLRRAIATVLSYYRYGSVHDYYGDTAKLIQYPIADSSWVSPKEWESSYAKAYRQKMDGSLIYTTRMTKAERKQAVLDAALEYFEAAGYTVEDGKLSKAPSGASLTYHVMVTGYGEKDHPAYNILKNASKALSSIGFKLKIQDVEESSEMFTVCQAGNAELWCAAWPTQDDPDSYMYSLHHSKGGSSYMYGISSEDLDSMITKAAATTDQTARKALYRSCLKLIQTYVVEVPTYQRQNCTLYSSKRVNMDTVTTDQTTHYNWWDEIHLLQMNESEEG